jgi:hypothetical protein
MIHHIYLWWIINGLLEGLLMQLVLNGNFTLPNHGICYVLIDKETQKFYGYTRNEIESLVKSGILVSGVTPDEPGFYTNFFINHYVFDEELLGNVQMSIEIISVLSESYV